MGVEINRFLGSEAIAVIGVSSSKMKFGSMAYRALKKKGYKVYGINPALESIDGDTCYCGLSDVPARTEAVFVAVKPEKVSGLIAEATRLGVKRIWFQQGANYEALAAQASEAGLDVVKDRCLLMYAEPVAGIHRVHRFFAKVFGQL